MQKEYSTLVRLGLPIMAGQLGITVQGVVDTIMLGHYGTAELAAVGFVNSLFTFASVVVMGFASGVIPLCGAAYGGGHPAKAVSVLKNALAVITGVALLAIAALAAGMADLRSLGQPDELHADMHCYLWWVLPSMLFVAWGSCCKSFFDSLTATRVAMWAILAGNVWNIVWNWLLIFGRCGFPELGVAGAAIATVSSRLVILLIYICVLLRGRAYAAYRRAGRLARLSWHGARQVGGIGSAISIQSGMEVGSFSLCSIFIGWMGAEALAAHQVACAVTTTIWIVYFSLGSATAVRVAGHTGRGDWAAVRNSSRCGLRMILCAAVILCTAFVCLSRHIFGMFTGDDSLTTLLIAIVPAVAVYQFSDATQTHFVNVLRGVGCVRYLVADAFVAYVAVCLPLSFCFGIVFGWGLPGVWWSYPVSLTIAAALYIRRYRRWSVAASVA